MTSARHKPLNERVSTYNSAGGADYTALGTWEAATDNNLVSDQQGEGLMVVGAGPHLDFIVAAGATTNASYFRRIFPHPSLKHYGDPNRGVLFYTTAVGGVVQIQEPYFQAQDMKSSVSFNDTGSRHSLLFAVGAANAAAVGWIGMDGSNPSGQGRGISSSGASSPVFAIDCLAYNNQDSGFYTSMASTEVHFRNCTSVGNGTNGFERTPEGIFVVKNCLAYDNDTADFSGTFTEGSTNNASSDTTAPGDNARTEQTFTFVAGGYHLAESDEGALGHGADLSADSLYPFDDDIDGDLWGGAWSIGYDQYAVPDASTLLTMGVGG